MHFTLVITAVAVAIAFTLDEASQASRAYTQLREIVSALENWNTRLIDERATVEHEQAKAALPRSFHIEFDEAVGGRESFDVVVTQGYRVSGFGDELARPQTLGDFAAIWDRLNDCCTVSSVTDIASEAAVWQIGASRSSPGWYPFTRTDELQNARRLQVRHWIKLAPESLAAQREAIQQRYPIALRGRLSTRGGEILFGIPAKELRRSFDGQQVFSEHAKMTWLKGPFAFSFPDLHEVTEGFDHLDFATLERIIANEAKRSGQNVETLGVKVPASAIGPWGLAALLTLQLYFLVNLRVLNDWLEAQPGRGEPFQVPWIGLYRGWPAGTLTVASLILLPLAVQMVIVAGAFEPAMPPPLGIKVLLGLYAVLGVSLAILTAFVLHKTRSLTR